MGRPRGHGSRRGPLEPNVQNRDCNEDVDDVATELDAVRPARHGVDRAGVRPTGRVVAGVARAGERRAQWVVRNSHWPDQMVT